MVHVDWSYRNGGKAPDGSRRRSTVGTQYGMAYVVKVGLRSNRRDGQCVQRGGGMTSCRCFEACACRAKKKTHFFRKSVGPPLPLPHTAQKSARVAWMTRVTKPSIGRAPNPQSDSAKLELFGDAMQASGQRPAPNWFYFSFLNFNLTKGRTPPSPTAMVPELKEKAEQSRYSLGHKDHWPLSYFLLYTCDLLTPPTPFESAPD